MPISLTDVQYILNINLSIRKASKGQKNFLVPPLPYRHSALITKIRFIHFSQFQTAKTNDAKLMVFHIFLLPTITKSRTVDSQVFLWCRQLILMKDLIQLPQTLSVAFYTSSVTAQVASGGKILNNIVS